MNSSLRQPSRHDDPRRLADLIPGRLAWFATFAVVLTAVGLVAGCGKSSSSTSAAAATKAASSSPTASAAASASPTPAGSPTAPPATASPATSSPAPASTVGNGTLEGSYSFQLTNGYSAPLGPTAPTQSEIAAGGSCDITYNGEIYSCNSEKVIGLQNGSTPTYSACTTGTLFVDDVDPTPGSAFCIIETSGRMAGVVVTAAGTSPNYYVTFKVTVWQYVAPAT